jgi:hypothetical protein
LEPVIDSFVTVAEQVRGDRVTVGLVVDQDATEVVETDPSNAEGRGLSPALRVTPRFLGTVYV